MSVIVGMAAWVAGGALLLAYATAQWHFARMRETGLEEFAAARQQVQELRATEASEPLMAVARDDVQIKSLPALRAMAPDMSAWSLGRITAYQAEDHSSSPQAVLHIPAINLEVPVYAGATESNLNRGAAWIEATAPLGAPGNTGLASHRDGYFRALGRIMLGDRIELRTLLRTQVYAVDDIKVVEPEEIQVLAPSSDERLTLVTCYPFYMVGPAPKRYVVRARAASARDPLQPTLRRRVGQ